MLVVLGLEVTDHLYKTVTIFKICLLEVDKRVCTFIRAMLWSRDPGVYSLG